MRGARQVRGYWRERQRPKPKAQIKQARVGRCTRPPSEEKGTGVRWECTCGRSRWLVPRPAVSPLCRAKSKQYFPMETCTKSGGGCQHRRCMPPSMVFAHLAHAREDARYRDKKTSVGPNVRKRSIFPRSTGTNYYVVRGRTPFSIFTEFVHGVNSPIVWCVKRVRTCRAPRLPRASPAPAAARPSFWSTQACP